MRKCKKAIRNFLWGFVLADRNVLPFHIISSVILSIGFLCLVGTIDMLIGLGGIHLLSPIIDDFGEELLNIPKDFSFLGTLIWIIIVAIFPLAILNTIDRKKGTQLKRIPPKVASKMILKSLSLPLLILPVIMIITGLMIVLYKP